MDASPTDAHGPTPPGDDSGHETGHEASDTAPTLTAAPSTSPRPKTNTARRPNLTQEGLGASLDLDAHVDLGTSSGTKSPGKSTRKPGIVDTKSHRSPTDTGTGISIGRKGPAARYAPDAGDQDLLASGDGDDSRASGASTDALGERGQGQKYVLIGEIARGGMSAVFKVFDRDIRRHIAMKVMDADPDDRARALRFVEEVQVTGQLEHPNIVPVHDVGLDADRNLFFTMKLVAGESLGEIIAQLRRGRPYKGFNNLVRRLEMFMKICDAVAFAHSRGVIHRDLKPSNVMVGDFGEVLVMDWGIAKLIRRSQKSGPASEPASGLNIANAKQIFTDRSESGDDPTLDGTVAGTPQYMPPEQARGEIDALDERADIYSLGAVLYELLTFRPPITGDSPYEILRQVVDGNVVPPRERTDTVEVPRELDAIVMKAMSPRKASRFRSVKEMQGEIQAFLDGQPLRHFNYSSVELLTKLVKRNRAFLWGTVVALIAVSALFVLGYHEFQVRHVSNLKTARQAGHQEYREYLAGRAQTLLEQMDAESRHYEKWVAEHRQFLAAYRHTRAAAETAAGGPAHVSPRDLAPAWPLFANAWTSAMKALNSRTRIEHLAAQILTITTDETEPAFISTGNLAKKRLADLRLRADANAGTEPAIDSAIAAALSRAVDESNMRRDDLGGYLDRTRYARGRLNLTVDTPGLAGGATIFIYYLSEGIRFRGEPRHLAVPYSPEAGLSVGISAQPLVGRRLSQMVTTLETAWLAAPPFPDLPHDYAEIGTHAAQRVPLIPGPYLLVMQWEHDYGVGRQFAVVNIEPGAEVDVFVSLPASRTDRVSIFRRDWLGMTTVVTTESPIVRGAWPKLMPADFVYLPEIRTMVNAPVRPGFAPQTQPASATNRVTVTRVPEMWASRDEITQGEYLEFLRDPQTVARMQTALAAGSALPFVPRGEWAPMRATRTGDTLGIALTAPFHARRPITGVSVEDAMAFATWKTARDGNGEWLYRLPTEAEWERLCGAVPGQRFVWGSWPEPAFAWVNRERPADVASYGTDAPFFAGDESPWGVRNLAGNVREWCIPGDGSVFDPAANFAVRGGSFRSCTGGPKTFGEMAIDATRYLPGTATADDLGFRLVRVRR